MNKAALIDARKEFFSEISFMLEKAPDEADKILNQEKFYVPISKTLINPAKGELMFHIPVDFYGHNFNVWYSFWQFSFELKIGIFVESEKLEKAFITDTHREINFLWGVGNIPRNDNSRGKSLYEWEFKVPRLYDSYVYREKFILGARHMHFRLMRVLHDECLHLSQVVSPSSSLAIE